MQSNEPPTYSNELNDILNEFGKPESLSSLSERDKWRLLRKRLETHIQQATKAAEVRGRIDEATGFANRVAKVLETEYPDKLNTDMTGHGALDIVQFAANDRIAELQAQLPEQEQES